jgi:hypothetical protein
MAAQLQGFDEIRYNLAWAWGYFTNLTLPFIGHSRALDSAVPALLAHHADYCRTSNNNADARQISLASKAIPLYNKALSELRMALDDPKQCSRTETLLAVMILAILQVIRVQSRESSHANPDPGPYRGTYLVMVLGAYCWCFVPDASA